MSERSIALHTSRRNRWRLTFRPETFVDRFINSSVVWLALMAYWGVADLLLAIFPPGGWHLQTETWLTFLLSRIVPTSIGLAAIWCMHRTGFPGAWDVRFHASRRLGLPLLVGAVGGLLAIGIEVAGGAVKLMEANVGP